MLEDFFTLPWWLNGIILINGFAVWLYTIYYRYGNVTETSCDVAHVQTCE
jgi:hypothetical protein